MGCGTFGNVASSCKFKLEIDFSFETELDLERDYLSRLQNSRAFASFQVRDIYITAKHEKTGTRTFILPPYFLLYIVVVLPHLSVGNQGTKPHRSPAEERERCDHNRTGKLKDSACEEFAKNRSAISDVAERCSFGVTA